MTTDPASARGEGPISTSTSSHCLYLHPSSEPAAAEIAQLARFIRARVHAEFGLLLQPEPVLVNIEL